jgi:hypothetical protein
VTAAASPPIISDVAQRVEHILDREFAARGLPHDAGRAVLAGAGRVGRLVGQWWLDARDLDRDEVAAHLVNLAWNGLSTLHPEPTLRVRDR